MHFTWGQNKSETHRALEGKRVHLNSHLRKKVPLLFSSFTINHLEMPAQAICNLAHASVEIDTSIIKWVWKDCIPDKAALTCPFQMGHWITTMASILPRQYLNPWSPLEQHMCQANHSPEDTLIRFLQGSDLCVKLQGFLLGLMFKYKYTLEVPADILSCLSA